MAGPPQFQYVTTLHSLTYFYHMGNSDNVLFLLYKEPLWFGPGIASIRIEAKIMNGKNKKILVVDDIADDRILTRMVLKKHNFSVVEAGSWAEALKAIRGNDLDLVISDIQMPELDLATLLQIIRSENLNKDVPVILYTSIFSFPCSTRDKKDYQMKGATDIVRKDDPPSVLLAKVKELLRLT